MPKEEKEEKRKVLGKLSETLRREFEEQNHEHRAIEDSIEQLLDRKVRFYRKHRQLWRLAIKELSLTEEQLRLPLGVNDYTGEVAVIDQELSDRERYTSLVKMLTSGE